MNYVRPLHPTSVAVGRRRERRLSRVEHRMSFLRLLEINVKAGNGLRKMNATSHAMSHAGAGHTTSLFWTVWATH